MLGCSSQLSEDDKRARWDYAEALSAYSAAYIAKYSEIDSELVNLGWRMIWENGQFNRDDG